MGTLVLVRHGETVGNSSVRYYGRTDVELSDLGQGQMRAAGRWLRGHLESTHFAPVIASPLRRASEGASIIVGAHGPVATITEFVEVDFGRFEGLTAEEIRERYPDDFARWDRDRLNPAFTYPEGDSRANFTRRVESGIQRMLRLIDDAALPPRTGRDTPSADETALVVAHRGVIRIVVNRLAGVEPQIELGSIHILQRATAGAPWRAKAFDIVEHLAALE